MTFDPDDRIGQIILSLSSLKEVVLRIEGKLDKALEGEVRVVHDPEAVKAADEMVKRRAWELGVTEEE